MKRDRYKGNAAIVMLLYGLASGIAGCDRDVAGQVAALSSAYLGDVVNTVVAAYLYGRLDLENGVSGDLHAHDSEHSHDAEPMHDHEH